MFLPPYISLHGNYVTWCQDYTCKRQNCVLFTKISSGRNHMSPCCWGNTVKHEDSASLAILFVHTFRSSHAWSQDSSMFENSGSFYKQFSELFGVCSVLVSYSKASLGHGILCIHSRFRLKLKCFCVFFFFSLFFDSKNYTTRK